MVNSAAEVGRAVSDVAACQLLCRRTLHCGALASRDCRAFNVFHQDIGPTSSQRKPATCPPMALSSSPTALDSRHCFKLQSVASPGWPRHLWAVYGSRQRLF